MALPAVIEPCLPSPGEQPPTGPDWVQEIKHDGYRLMARRDALSVGIRLLTRNGHDWASRYPLIVEGFDDTLAGYRRAARHRRHATLDSVPARRLRRCLGRSRAFVSGRGVSVCLDVAEAGGALRANESLESIFEFNPGDLVYQHACKLGLEGIVSKRLGSAYRSGRTSDWLKFKNPDAPAVKREAEEDWGK